MIAVDKTAIISLGLGFKWSWCDYARTPFFIDAAKMKLLLLAPKKHQEKSITLPALSTCVFGCHLIWHLQRF